MMSIGGFIFKDLRDAAANTPSAFGSFRGGLKDQEEIRNFFRRRELQDDEELYADNPEAAAYARAGLFDAAQKSSESKRKAAREPSEYEKVLQRKQAEKHMQDMEDAESAPEAEKNVLKGIQLLEEIADADRIGSWTRTRWLGQSGNEQRDLAKINQAAALLAPSSLKAYAKAGGSKPNSDFEAILATGIDTKNLTSAQAGEIAKILRS
jgi:hypothetical protein